VDVFFVGMDESAARAASDKEPEGSDVEEKVVFVGEAQVGLAAYTEPFVDSSRPARRQPKDLQSGAKLSDSSREFADVPEVRL
jgi:hypothetical protein